MKAPPCILLVEQDATVAATLVPVLQGAQSGQVEVTSSLEAGLQFARNRACSLVFVGASCADPRMGGIEEVRRCFPAPVIFTLPLPSLASAFQLESWEWVAAPFARAEVHRAIAAALRIHALETRVRQSQKRIRQEEGLADLGRSAARAGADFQRLLSEMSGILRGIQSTATPEQGPSFLRLEHLMQRADRVAGQLNSGSRAPVAPEVNGRLQTRPRSPTVLVVDDEESIRDLAAFVIQQMGWQVITAKDGDEAFMRFQADPGQFSLVLLDLSLPRMSGLDVVAGIRALRPALPVVMITGHGEDALATDARLALSGLLHKPFSPDALRAALQRGLAAEAPSVLDGRLAS